MFGPNTSHSHHPFSDAVVDGFDFAMEHRGSGDNLGYWVVSMKSLMKEEHARGGKKYYLSAAPPCSHVNTNILLDVLARGGIDMIFVRFYNNPDCSSGGQDDPANLGSWTVSAGSQNGRWFMGLPADPKAVGSQNGSGYLEPDRLKTELQELVNTLDWPFFGGVALWDASQAQHNDDYHVKVKDILKET